MCNRNRIRICIPHRQALSMYSIYFIHGNHRFDFLPCQYFEFSLASASDVSYRVPCAHISIYIYVFVGLADQRNQRDTIIISIHSSHSCPLKCAALHHAHSFNVKRSLGFCGCVLEYFLRRTECYTNRISCSLPYMSDRTIDKQQEKLREYESWWCVDAVSFKYWRRMSVFCVGINDSVEPHDALSVIRICDRRSIHNLFIVSRNWNIPLSSFFTLSLSRVYLTKISDCQAKKKGETTIYH